MSTATITREQAAALADALGAASAALARLAELTEELSKPDPQPYVDYLPERFPTSAELTAERHGGTR